MCRFLYLIITLFSHRIVVNILKEKLYSLHWKLVSHVFANDSMHFEGISFLRQSCLVCCWAAIEKSYQVEYGGHEVMPVKPLNWKVNEWHYVNFLKSHFTF